MKCEKCGKEIKLGDKFFTAVGFVQCEECTEKSDGTISMDDIFNKVLKTVNQSKK